MQLPIKQCSFHLSSLLLNLESVAHLGGVDTKRCPPLFDATIATYGEEMDLLNAGHVKSKIRDMLFITVGHTSHREMLRLIQILRGSSSSSSSTKGPMPVGARCRSRYSTPFLFLQSSVV